MVVSPSMKDQLLAKIQDRTAVIGVIGLGYVGLPLAMEFVHAGFRVIGYDVSQRVVDLLMAGQSHIQDIPHHVVQEAVAAGSFVATAVESRSGDCDAISVAVPTPLSKRMSLPIMLTRFKHSGPLPTIVAPLTGYKILPFSTQ